MRVKGIGGKKRRQVRGRGRSKSSEKRGEMKGEQARWER